MVQKCTVYKKYKKMSEKSVFRKASSPEMTLRSFPVSCFWSRGYRANEKKPVIYTLKTVIKLNH